MALCPCSCPLVSQGNAVPLPAASHRSRLGNDEPQFLPVPGHRFRLQPAPGGRRLRPVQEEKSIVVMPPEEMQRGHKRAPLHFFQQGNQLFRRLQAGIINMEYMLALHENELVTVSMSTPNPAACTGRHLTEVDFSCRPVVKFCRGEYDGENGPHYSSGFGQSPEPLSGDNLALYPEQENTLRHSG